MDRPSVHREAQEDEAEYKRRDREIDEFWYDDYQFQKKHGYSQYFDGEDLARGSFGKHVDKYLGKSPCDGPSGYIFRKVTYTATAAANNTKVVGVYKTSSDHMGHIYGGPGTTAEVRINQDGADRGTGTTDPSGLLLTALGEAKLVSGDYILGSILTLVDGRSNDKRTGYISAGLASHPSAEPDTYGTDMMDDPSQFITSSSISGGKHASAASAKAVSVCTPNLNIHAPYRVATAGLNASADLNQVPLAEPLSAINVSGIDANQSTQIRFELTVYALVGPRNRNVTAYVAPDTRFKMSCLTKQVATHPVTIIY